MDYMCMTKQISTDVFMSVYYFVQTQALIVALIAAVVAILLGFASDHVWNWKHVGLLIGSSLFTASLASLVLGCVMCVVVYGSHRLHIDPDNVATPIAASLGDITTLALLVGSSGFMYKYLYSSKYTTCTAMCLLLWATLLFSLFAIQWRILYFKY